MDKNKLLKLDGEYVKLYVTKNTSLPKLLKNSGSLIVLNDDNNSDVIESLWDNKNSNYLYLGNEVIAGGFGFNDVEQKDKAIGILKDYYNDIQEIHDSISNECNEREEEDGRINEKIRNLVSIGSDLSSLENGLYISSNTLDDDFFLTDDNEEQIKIKDLINFLKPAEYDDISISNISQDCEVGFFESDNTFETIDPIKIDGVLYVPYGSTLSSYTITIDSSYKDSGGIRGILLWKTNVVNGEERNNEICFIEKGNNDSNQPNSDNARDLFKIKFSKSNNPSTDTYFDPNDSNYNKGKSILSKFSIDVLPTQVFKKFPLLESYNIYSTENSIKSHKIEYPTLDIIPKYLVFYNNVVSKSNVNEISHEVDLRTFDNYSMMMNDDYVDLVDVDFGDLENNYKFWSLAIPTSYIIKNIYIIKDNKKHNITGFFKRIYFNCSLNPLYYNADTLYPYSFLYMMNDIAEINGKVTIRIYLDKTEPKMIGEQEIGESIDLAEMFIENTTILDSDEFDANHWFSGYNESFANWLFGEDEENKKTIYLDKVKERFTTI